jgi:putative transposase
MSRYRLVPTPQQALILREHCSQARFVWNLALEQHLYWRPGRAAAPGYVAQCRQLTEARTEFPWLAAGSQTVQQQALRDFSQAMAAFFAGTRRRPTWRKAGRNEGFRIVGSQGQRFRRLSRHAGAVWVPKAGWLRFRWSRPVPEAIKSYRVTCDRAGRWYIAFAAIPPPIPGPGNGETVGIDRGVVVSAALSTGELLTVPRLSRQRQHRLKLLQRRLSRAKPGSGRRRRIKVQAARLQMRQTDLRKDWCEKASTGIARCFDVIRMDDLRIRSMTRSAKGSLTRPGRHVAAKAGLNREIMASGWGLLARRLEDKAPGRVEKINPAYTSQRCSACRTVDARARESQAVFACRSCGYVANADVNAAKNIAAGQVVTARGGREVARPVNREPRLGPLKA